MFTYASILTISSLVLLEFIFVYAYHLFWDLGEVTSLWWNSFSLPEIENWT